MAPKSKVIPAVVAGAATFTRSKSSEADSVSSELQDRLL
jgi:hypothetical protein